MANPILISITLPNGNTYDIVDQGARDLIKELMNIHEYLGVTTTALVDGSTTNPITIDGQSVTAEAGDVVTLSSDSSEMVFDSLGEWHVFGSLSGLGALAFKNSASGSFTPQGSISASFSGSETTSTGKFTPSGSVSASFSGTATTSTGVFTPQGSVSSSGGTKTIKQFKTAGSMPTYAVSNGNLTISAGEVPTGEDVSVGDGSVSSTFSGTEGSLSVSGTPTGSVSASFSGTEDDVTVKGTPSGSVSGSFSGTAGTVTVS